MLRRACLPLAVAMLSLAASAGGHAQALPSRPITLVSAAPAGSPPDVLTRALAQQISKLTKASVVVENKPGASMQLAAQAVARARPDGHTVLITGSAAFTVNPHLFKALTYDAEKSFIPVTTLSKGAWLWAVNSRTVPARKIPELVQFAKTHPKRLTYADSSPSTRVLAEIIQRKAGIELYPVAYRTATQAIPDLLAGRLDMVFVDPGIAHSATSEAIHILGWTDIQRLPQLPDIPTLDESGLPGATASYWLGAYTPAGTPRAVNEKLADLFAQASGSPEVHRAHQAGGTYSYLVSLRRMSQLQEKEGQEWGRLIKEAGIEPQ